MRVVDESMAFYLAELLNALDRGDALPPPGEQHRPVRFQLVHDPTGLGTKARPCRLRVGVGASPRAGLVATFAWPFVVAVLIVYLSLGAVVWRRSRR
jgi:hypothetical protein